MSARGKSIPASMQEEVVLPLEDECVQAELTEAAERDEPDRLECRRSRARLTPTPPASRASSARQIAANSTTDSVSARLDPSTLRDLKYSLR